MGGNQVLVSRGAFSEDATLSFSTATLRGLTQDLGQYDQVNPSAVLPGLSGKRTRGEGWGTSMDVCVIWGARPLLAYFSSSGLKMLEPLLVLFTCKDSVTPANVTEVNWG